MFGESWAGITNSPAPPAIGDCIAAIGAASPPTAVLAIAGALLWNSDNSTADINAMLAASNTVTTPRRRRSEREVSTTASGTLAQYKRRGGGNNPAPTNTETRGNNASIRAADGVYSRKKRPGVAPRTG